MRNAQFAVENLDENHDGSNAHNFIGIAFQPKFTIRAVQEGERDDGYTIGRAILNMFSSGWSISPDSTLIVTMHLSFR